MILSDVKPLRDIRIRRNYNDRYVLGSIYLILINESFYDTLITESKMIFSFIIETYVFLQCFKNIYTINKALP